MARGKGSRTGTTAWKKLRLRALKQAQSEGITHCPTCRVLLDYTTGRNSNSAVPDHVTPHVFGGLDSLDNLIIRCHNCNSRDGQRIGMMRVNAQNAPQHVENIDFINDTP